MGKRLLDIDFCKGLLIIFVVWGHVCANSSGIDYEKNALTMYIRLFQMPLFFVISGLFQKQCDNIASLLKSFKNTFWRLGVPLIAWSIVYYVTIMIVQNRPVGGVFSMLGRGPIHYWFFTCLILCKVYYSFVDLIAHFFKANRFLMHIMSVVLLLLVPYDFFHFTFSYLFFLLGILFMKYKLPRIPRLYLLFATVIVLIIGFYYPTKWTFYNTSMYLFDSSVNYKFLFIIVRWLIYIIATFVAFEWIRKVYYKYEQKKVIAIVTKIGEKTLLIYGLHIVIISDVYGYMVKESFAPYGLLSDYPFLRYYVLATVITIVLLCLCFAFDSLSRRNKYLSILLLGERKKLV